MLPKKQQESFGAFYDTAHENDILDPKTTFLLHLGTAMAVGCSPCMQAPETAEGQKQAALGRYLELSADQGRSPDRRLGPQAAAQAGRCTFDRRRLLGSQTPDRQAGLVDVR